MTDAIEARETSPGAPEAEARRREPKLVRSRILAAAREVFAARGFDGATLNLVAKRAGSNTPLIVYHFKSKLELWRAVVESMSGPADRRLKKILSRRELSAADRLREVVAMIVDMLAETPEIHRIVLIDGYADSDRLTWMIDTYVRGFNDGLVALIREAQAEGAVRDLDPTRLRYAILGVAALPAVSAEYRAVAGRDPADPDELKGSIDFILKLIFKD